MEPSFVSVSDSIAISIKSATDLLGDSLQPLTYTLKFNEASEKNFAVGFSKVSAAQSFDLDNAEDAATFFELDSDEPEQLCPPYEKGTTMNLKFWRKKEEVDNIYCEIEVGEHRSGTYAFSCLPNQDYLAIRCASNFFELNSLNIK